MKTCIKCNNTYPKTSQYFFYRNKSKGWLSSWCKSCKKQHRNKNMDRELELQRNRRGLTSCRICGENKSKGDSYCPSCKTELKRNKKREDKAIYKSRLRKAKPKWANSFLIKEIYSLARLRTETTGIEWHVDHIIPIRGKNVCGLHTEINLQVMIGADNMRKSNHYSFEHQGRQ